MRKPRWTPSDIEKLKTYFPHRLNSEMVEILGRSEGAIAQKANELGIKKKLVRREDRAYNTTNGHAVYWTDQMLSMLKKYYSNTRNEEIAGILGMGVRTVIRKARQLGLVKDPAWMRAMSQAHVKMTVYYQNPTNNGRFQKGHAPTGCQYQKGHIPDNAQPVVRLDTNQIYNSCKALADVLGVSASAVVLACHRKGNTAGVAVRFCSDMPCGSCKNLVGISDSERNIPNTMCGCGLDSHITTTDTTGCKKHQFKTE